MNSLEAAGSNGDDRGSLRHAHATRPGCVGPLFTTFHRTNPGGAPRHSAQLPARTCWRPTDRRVSVAPGATENPAQTPPSLQLKGADMATGNTQQTFRQPKPLVMSSSRPPLFEWTT